jgi:aspartate carbamoyltransferase catalytic subunit
VDCSVVNAATASTSIRRRRCWTSSPCVGRSAASPGLTAAICGDVAHSRVARSNVALLNIMGASVRLVGRPR